MVTVTNNLSAAQTKYREKFHVIVIPLVSSIDIGVRDSGLKSGFSIFSCLWCLSLVIKLFDEQKILTNQKIFKFHKE